MKTIRLFELWNLFRRTSLLTFLLLIQLTYVKLFHHPIITSNFPIEQLSKIYFLGFYLQMPKIHH